MKWAELLVDDVWFSHCSLSVQEVQKTDPEHCCGEVCARIIIVVFIISIDIFPADRPDIDKTTNNTTTIVY